MNRRQALGLGLAAVSSTLPLVAACGRKGALMNHASEAHDTKTPASPAGGGTMPVLFIAHGAPPLLDDPSWQAELAAWGQAIPRPKAILSLSAHWEAQPIAIGATEAIPLVYDFYGFPERYYQVQYPAPGAPGLAARVRDLLREKSIAFVDEPTRGLDHGTYVPLLSMYPAADIPVLQVSLPGLDPEELHAFGQALGPLRKEGVLVAGSGFLTHNMRSFRERSTPAWASEFDDWATQTLMRRDTDALLDFRRRAPSARLAHPREEHFAPLIAAAGAAEAAGGDVRFPITGWWNIAKAFSRRSLQIG